MTNTVIVTGGSRGIGAATALACARRGFGVILTYHSSADRAAAVVRGIAAAGGKALALPLDVGDSAGFAAFRSSVEAALREHWDTARLAGLVNNAGHGLFEAIESVTEAQFDGLLNVHLKGPFFLTQALLPLMQEGAGIVNLSSATVRMATAGVAPYAAFKGGLEVLSRYMAKEFGARRIRVNSVAPGAIHTGLGGGLSEEFESLLAGQTALGRVGEPEDVARVVAMLLGPDGAWINGQNIEVAGGYLI